MTDRCWCYNGSERLRDQQFYGRGGRCRRGRVRGRVWCLSAGCPLLAPARRGCPAVHLSPAAGMYSAESNTLIVLMEVRMSATTTAELPPLKPRQMHLVFQLCDNKGEVCEYHLTCGSAGAWRLQHTTRPTAYHVVADQDGRLHCDCPGGRREKVESTCKHARAVRAARAVLRPVPPPAPPVEIPYQAHRRFLESIGESFTEQDLREYDQWNALVSAAAGPVVEPLDW